MSCEIPSVAQIQKAYIQRLVEDVRKEPEQVEQKKEVERVQEKNRIDRLV
jgi:hypothetical protein|tara:strand:+ start:918 stop:1067 length:150 start_codon:yes stop_codon:yes gene_type:complete